MRQFYILLIFLFAANAKSQTLNITISKNGSNQLVMILNQDASFQFNQTLPVASNSSPSLIIKNVFTTAAANLLSNVDGGSGIAYLSNTPNSGNAVQMGTYGFNYGVYNEKDAVILFPEHSTAFQPGNIITIKAGTILSFRTYDNSNANNTIPAINAGPYTAYIVSQDFNSIAAPQVTVLPIELTSFTGHNENSSVVLNWETSSELNNKGFDIEHSVNKTGWKSIGLLDGKDTKEGISKYEFVHLNPTGGQNYYRLKSIDFNGNFKYSPVIAVKTISQINVVITPNPSSNIIKVEGISIGTVTILDMQGKIVKTQDLSEGEINIGSLNPGYYIVKVLNNDNNYIQKILKN